MKLKSHLQNIFHFDPPKLLESIIWLLYNVTVFIYWTIYELLLCLTVYCCIDDAYRCLTDELFMIEHARTAILQPT